MDGRNVTRLGLSVITSVLLVAAGGCAKKAPKGGAALVHLDGVVRTAAGEAPAAVHVAVERIEGGKPVAVNVAADGTFDASVPAGVPVTITAAAPFHEEVELPALFDPGHGKAHVEITLAPNPRPERFDDVRIISDFKNFSLKSAEPMKQREDGTWIWSHDGIEGDTFAYELVGVTTNGHTVNGTQNDGFEYDGGGDFRSVLHPKDGSVTVVFDPKLLPAAATEELPRVAWDSNHAALEQCFFVQRIRERMQADIMAAFRKHRAGGGSEEDFHFETAPYKKELRSIVSDPGAGLAAPMARLQLMVMGGPGEGAEDPERAKAVLADIPPESPAWVLVPDAPPAVLQLAGNEGDSLAQAFHDRSPFKDVRLAALEYQVRSAKRAGDRDRWTKLYAEFKEIAGASPRWRWTLQTLDPDKKIRKGNPVPKFSVKLLDGSTFSNADLRGHTTLIDFWATWCGPCRREMPYLHEAWKKFHSKGLQILSLSFDESPDDIVPFRKKWPMPWKHAFVKGGFGSDVAKSFEVRGIPEPILVGPDGTILATEPETRGEELAKTLGKYLGE